MSQAIASPKHPSSKHASPKQLPAPGSIDTSFGEDGFVYLEEPGNTGRYPSIAACASNNEHHFIYAIMAISDLDSAICRLHGATGEIDTSFGDLDGHKGYRRLPYGPDPYVALWNHIVIADSTSTIVLGYALDPWGHAVAPLACRILHDGTLDASFGEEGLGFYPIPTPPLRHIARRVAVPRPASGRENGNGARAELSADAMQASRLADGSLLFLARLYDGGASYLFKIDRDGHLDPSFAGTGYLLVGNISQGVYSFQVESAGDGKILVAGSAGPDTGLVMRYESRGYLDITFGIGGRVEITDPAWGCLCRGVSIAADRKILVLVALFGEGFPLRHQAAAVLRLDRDGKRDPSFNNGELAIADMAPHLFIGSELAVDEGTRPLIGANKVEIQGGFLAYYPMLARFLGDGRRDHTFGANGISGVISPGAESAVLIDIAVQDTQKILIVGSAAPPYIARVNG